MKKITLYKISKILPLLVVIAILLSPTVAHAGIISWAKDQVVAIGNAAVDKAEQAAAAFLGIDDIECEVPVVSPTYVPSASGKATASDVLANALNPDCVFCSLFSIIFNASSGVAAISYKAFHSDLGKIILIFLAVSLALITLKNLASTGAKEAGAFMNEIFTRAFVCAAIYIIVTKDYYNLVNMTIVPIIQEGLDFVGLGGGICSISPNLHLAGFATHIIGSVLDIDEVLPYELGHAIVTAICNIEQKINVLFDYAKWGWCLGTGPERIYHVIPSPIHLIDGALLYIGGIIFIITYPWILADAVLQLGISMALFPFAVAGYAFSGTKKYLPKVFNWILHSLFTFMFMAILLACILDYISKMLAIVFLEVSAASLSSFFINPNIGIAFFGPNMIKILFVLAVGWVYMPSIRSLTDNFAEGSGLSAGAATGQPLINKIESTTGRAAAFARDATGNATVWAANATRRGVTSYNRNFAITAAKTFGHQTGNGKSYTFAGTKYTTRKTALGQDILEREYTSGKYRYVKLSDKYSEIVKVYDSNNRLIRTETKFKHNFSKKYLVDKDGQVNIGALEKLLDSPLGQDPEARQAIMEQVAVNVLKKQGVKIGSYYNQRNVVFDPNNPNRIIVEQIDHNGQTTRFGLEIDRRTGQTKSDFLRETIEKPIFGGEGNEDRYITHTEAFVNNGAVQLHVKGTKTADGRVISEKTTFRYSDRALKGHDNILGKESKQIVDKNGNISSDLQSNNNLNLMFGLDNIAGMQYIGGQTTSSFILHDILQRGRVMQTNSFRSSIFGRNPQRGFERLDYDERLDNNGLENPDEHDDDNSDDDERDDDERDDDERDDDERDDEQDSEDQNTTDTNDNEQE